jgi:hypothetical protein
MTMQLLAINVEVQCADGTAHQGVKLAVEGARRVYLAADGTEINDVESMTRCTVVVPPMIFAAALHRCMECK